MFFLDFSEKPGLRATTFTVARSCRLFKNLASVLRPKKGRLRFWIIVALLSCVRTISWASEEGSICALTIPTEGHPYAAWATPDGKKLLVTETALAKELGYVDLTGTGKDFVGGVEVFDISNGMIAPERFVILGSFVAQGLTAIPSTGALSIAMSNGGIMIVDLEGLLRGDVVQVLMPFGKAPGSAMVASSKDGNYLFVANEYDRHGTVGIVALRHRESAVVAANPINSLSVPNTVPGITLSPDGSRLYVTSERGDDIDDIIDNKSANDYSNQRCIEGETGPSSTGHLYVFDVEQVTKPGESAVPIAKVAAGCSPVRPLVSRDGTRVYVSARADNKILEFDRKKLETDPSRALLRALPSGGTSPVGMQLSEDGQLLIVANSDRFSHNQGSVSIIDLLTGMTKKIIQAGLFPRNIAELADHKTYVVTNARSNSIQTICER